MSLKLVKFAEGWDYGKVAPEEPEELIEIGELELAEPAFRKKARIIARTSRNGVRFALQYQHEGEKDVWLDDPSFPWHGRNFSSVVRAAARYYDRIEQVLKGEEYE